MNQRVALWLVVGCGVLLIAFGLRELTLPEAKPVSQSAGEPSIVTEETGEMALSTEASRLPGAEASGAPTPSQVEVIAREDHEDHTLVLVKQNGEYPWVRIEATFEFDEVGESEQIVAYEHFAADRVRVVARQGVMPSEILQWAAGLGAQARALDSPPTRYELVWQQVDLETLSESLQTVLDHQELIVLAEPVDVPFEGGVEIEVKEPLE